MHIQNHAYTNKSRHTYVCNIHQLLNTASFRSKSLLQLFHKFLKRYIKCQHAGMLIMSMLIQERSACYLRIIWKYLRMKLLLTAITNGLLKTFSDSFISLDGILSMPVYFLLSIIIESFSWIISRNCWKVAAPAVGLRLAWLASD